MGQPEACYPDISGLVTAPVLSAQTETELACAPCDVRWRLRDGAACWSCGKPGSLAGIYLRFRRAPRPPDSGHLDDGTSAAGEDRA